MDYTIIAILILILLAIGGTIFLVYKVISFIKTATKDVKSDPFWGKLIEQIGKAIDWKFQQESLNNDQSLQQERLNKFRNELKNFHFLDRSQIEHSYPTISSKTLPTKTEKKTMGARRGKLAVGTSEIGGSIQAEKGTEIQETLVHGEQIQQKYETIQNHLIDNGGITLGLETFSYDKQRIEQFKTNCGMMENTYSYEISEEEINNHIETMIVEEATKMLDTFAQASGYTIVDAEFQVTKYHDQFYKLSLLHPVNEHLSEDKHVKITINCNEESVLNHNLFQVGKSARIICLGKILSWSADQNELEIHPMIIY